MCRISFLERLPVLPVKYPQSLHCMGLMSLDRGGQAAAQAFGKSIRPQLNNSSSFFQNGEQRMERIAENKCGGVEKASW